MPKKYLNSFKKSTVLLIKKNNLSRTQTAQRLGVPIKTLEKWITAYNKNPKVFNKIDKVEENEYDTYY